MVIVMLAIAMSLALTYGFVRTQVTSLRLTVNNARRDLAMEAARTGLAIGLQRMQSPSWIGVADVYSKVILQDTANKSDCVVTFEPVISAEVPGVSDAELPLHLWVVSKGRWTSPANATEQVTRTAKAVVRLMPRLPGRTVRAGDSASVNDLKPNTAEYEATLGYSLSTTSTKTALNFDPGTRVEGPVWLRDDLQFFKDPNWSNTVRATMLTETGNLLGTTSGASAFIHPHPLNGPILFCRSPKSGVQSDLSSLKTTWSTTSSRPTIATFNSALWSSYQLYERGMTYQAVAVSGILENQTLRPTADNPLGIFIRNGDLTIRNGVTIQGTLIATGDISVWGSPVIITSYNWRGTSGTPVISGADQWPRLPAIVGRQLSFGREARAVIEGSVILYDDLTGGGAEFNWMPGTQVNLTGTATATRSQQPYSTVQLNNSPTLDGLTGDQTYAIWLENGSSGRWYQIQSVDAPNRKLTVVGEIETASAVNYRICLNRRYFVEISGPVLADSMDINRCLPWDLTSTLWDSRLSNWNATNQLLAQLGQPRIPFPTWLANPANFNGWLPPLPQTGLPLEPTFHLRPMPGPTRLFNGPLFRPYSTSSTSTAAYSGYRWKVIDWREDS